MLGLASSVAQNTDRGIVRSPALLDLGNAFDCVTVKRSALMISFHVRHLSLLIRQLY